MLARSLLVFAALVALPSLARAQAHTTVPENTRAACTNARDDDGDGHVDCDDQDCQDFTFCAAAPTQRTAPLDDTARLRGRGVTEVVVGSVLLSLGVVIGATSSALWLTGAGHYGFNEYDQGAVAMDVVGVAMIGTGTAFLAIGAGNLAQARRPRVAFGPTSLAVRF